MPKKLTEDELNEVRRWLIDQDINPNKIHREFSDCVAIAQLLKKFFPKLVDLHNYPPRNNTLLKLNNWETLNKKVLTRLGLTVTKNMIEKLAKGMNGAIESLLCEIMLLENSVRAKEEKNDNNQEQVWTENDEVMTVTVNKKIGDAIVQVPQKMILYSIYEQQVREAKAKEEALNAAEQKMSHLENIVLLKAERIDELCTQLAKLSVRSLLKQQNLENSSPKPKAASDENGSGRGMDLI